MDPQFNTVNTNNLESVGKGKRMAKKNKKYSNDGDTAHFETAREKEKAMKAPLTSGIYTQSSKRKSKSVTPTDSNSSVKYTGKGKTARKRISGK